jgi:aspartate kinase
MKFGGAALATIPLVQNAAKLIARRARLDQVIVVVSAMGDVTDQLLALVKDVSAESPLETDTVLAAGEQISAGLLSIALQNQGIQARSFLAHQIPIFTDGSAGNAQITAVGTEAIERALRQGLVPVIAGFQGLDAGHRLVTLGRGGSDKTAVAVAARFGAYACEFYKDVSGVFTDDPHQNAQAEKLNFMSFEQMHRLASAGAQVLHEQAVALAGKLGVPLYVRSAFAEDAGTWIGIDQSSIKKEVIG